MPPIPADLQQNIIITLYLTVLHNFTALSYFLGLVVATAWAFYKPSRPLILAMAGFALLLFSFEYNKHIVEGIRTQTISSIITEQPHYQAQHLLNILFNKLIPLGTPLVGWGLLAAACLLGLRSKLARKPAS